jgi:hypothetical protein
MASVEPAPAAVVPTDAAGARGGASHPKLTGPGVLHRMTEASTDRLEDPLWSTGLSWDTEIAS